MTIRLTIDSVVVRQKAGTPQDPVALRGSLEASLTRGIADHRVPPQLRDAHLLQSRAVAPNPHTNIGAAISDAVLRALGKGR